MEHRTYIQETVMEQDREEEGNRMKKKWEKYFF